MAGERKRTPAEINELKESIAVMLTQAVPHAKIFKALNIPKPTFYRYYDQLAKEFREDHLRKANRIIFGFGARSMARVRELQRKYDEDGDYHILEKAQAIEKNIMDLYQDLGILERAPEKITQELTLVSYKEPEWLKKKKEGEENAKR